MTDVEAPRQATLIDVAAQASVSRATVSLVLRQSPLVATGTRERVEEAIAAVGYVYNRGAARLRTGLSGTIGVIVPEITNPFYADLTAGIDETLDAAGRLTFLANSNESPQRQERFVRRIKEQGVDGVILCAAVGTSAALIAQLKTWRLPCVQILRTVEGAEGDFIGPDFRAGVAMVISHLVTRGHTRIALLPSSKRTSASEDRVNAFVSSMVQYGLKPGPVRTCTSSQDAVANEVGRLLEGSDPPTAFVCHNDLMALGAVGELARRGLKLGSSFSVVGFDDIPEASRAVPRLSSVATFPNEIGSRAATLLLNRIASPLSPHQRLLLKPRLIVRET
jgi:LacI family transcriptional regulator